MEPGPLGVCDACGLGISKTPLLDGSSAIFTSKCCFCCNDEGWQMKKGKKRHKHCLAPFLEAVSAPERFGHSKKPTSKGFEHVVLIWEVEK
jgi:hypothetical protein